MPIVSGHVNLNKRYTPAQHTARRHAATEALARIYCDVIGLWHGCGDRRCKRHRRCCGASWPCLQRGRSKVLPSLRGRIHEQVRAGGPFKVAPVNSVESTYRRHPPAGWL